MAAPEQIDVLDQGFVRLDGALADDLSVVNAARVSFGVRKTAMEPGDEGLIRFLMRERHGSPFEHNSFRFHIRCPIFVAREWFRHRVGCLEGSAVVTFVDTNGSATRKLSKTVRELYEGWNVGERDGQARDQAALERARQLVAAGVSVRSAARTTGLGRRAINRYLSGDRPHGLRDGRRRLAKMRLRVLDEDSFEFTTGRLLDVVASGVKPVYDVYLADGKRLAMTADHRILTIAGWQTLREAVGLVGEREEARPTRVCSVMVNGIPIYQDRAWMEAQRASGASVADIAAAAGCSYHTVRKWLRRHDLQFTKEERSFAKGHKPWNDGVRGYTRRSGLTEEGRQRLRDARSGSNSNFWRGGVTPRDVSDRQWASSKAPIVHARYEYRCQKCDERGGRLHAHHIVPVWRDPSMARDVGNLITVCEPCHRAIHVSERAELAFLDEHADRIGYVRDEPLPPRRARRMAAHDVQVTAVVYRRDEETFDLCVEGPWHNFVANGMVVHNSFNELSGRYTELPAAFYVPAADDVRSQVGKPGAYTFEPVDDEVAERTRERMTEAYEAAYATYRAMLDDGVAKEVARSVLPVGIYTEFYWTLNARSLMNFLSLRNAETAQREIRRYAEAVEQHFARLMPVTHAAFVARERVAP